MSSPMTANEFARIAPIHLDSLPDYRRWETLLRKWNAKINLVAPDSLPDFWKRHALDSAQIIPHIPETARTIVDFGSGAGFPAIALAIDAKYVAPDRHIHMIESAGKKASFLKSVSRETFLHTSVHSERIEAMDPLDADLITARAFAPLHRLLPMAHRHLRPEGSLILLKGSAFETEIAEATHNWSFERETLPSLSDETGVILKISQLRPC